MFSKNTLSNSEAACLAAIGFLGTRYGVNVNRVNSISSPSAPINKHPSDQATPTQAHPRCLVGRYFTVEIGAAARNSTSNILLYPPLASECADSSYLTKTNTSRKESSRRQLRRRAVWGGYWSRRRGRLDMRGSCPCRRCADDVMLSLRIWLYSCACRRCASGMKQGNVAIELRGASGTVSGDLRMGLLPPEEASNR